MAKQFIINSDFTEYSKIFLKENSNLNLISKNDEQFLYEKHIYDSLAISLANVLKDGQQLLDIGCGGGFPCIPIAIEYPNVNVTGIDSIQKKINSLNIIKEQLGLTNFSTICSRVENIKNKKFDIITSRAVAKLSKITEYALPLLKQDGYFVAYKSKKVLDEVDSAKSVLKKFGAEVLNVIEYTLPLDEVYQRNLVIIGFKKQS